MAQQRTSLEFSKGAGAHIPAQVSQSNPANSPFGGNQWTVGGVGFGTGSYSLPAQAAISTVQANFSIGITGLTNIEVPTNSTAYILYSVSLIGASASSGVALGPIMGQLQTALNFAGAAPQQTQNGIATLQPNTKYTALSIQATAPIYVPAATTYAITYNFSAWALLVGIL